MTGSGAATTKCRNPDCPCQETDLREPPPLKTETKEKA